MSDWAGICNHVRWGEIFLSREKSLQFIILFCSEDINYNLIYPILFLLEQFFFIYIHLSASFMFDGTLKIVCSDNLVLCYYNLRRKRLNVDNTGRVWWIELWSFSSFTKIKLTTEVVFHIYVYNYLLLWCFWLKVWNSLMSNNNQILLVTNLFFSIGY